MKIGDAKRATLADKMADAKSCACPAFDPCHAKKDAVADAILALADPEWWDRRHKGSDVFLLILESRKAEAMKIIQEATK